MDNQQQNFNNQKIIDEYVSGTSANKLSQLYNKNISTIMRLLRKNNVTIRSIGDNVMTARYNKEKLNFKDDFTQILKGLLMGDGSLRINENGRNPSYNHTDKHIETIVFLKEVFEQEGVKTSAIWQNKVSKCYTFQTECREEFMLIYNLFYPVNSKKRLPNINLTPLILLHWYIGDGSVKKRSGTIKNAAQIANKWGNNYILSQLKILFSENCNYYIYSINNIEYGNFYIPHKGFIKMLDYIGECPILSYDYK